MNEFYIYEGAVKIIKKSEQALFSRILLGGRSQFSFKRFISDDFSSGGKGTEGKGQ